MKIANIKNYLIMGPSHPHQKTFELERMKKVIGLKG